MTTPHTPTPPDRPSLQVSQTAVAERVEAARLASLVSPNGLPLVPPRFVPWLMGLALLGGAPATLLAAGVTLPASVVSVASAIGGLALLLLGASPGLRKKG